MAGQLGAEHVGGASLDQLARVLGQDLRHLPLRPPPLRRVHAAPLVRVCLQVGGGAGDHRSHGHVTRDEEWKLDTWRHVNYNTGEIVYYCWLYHFSIELHPHSSFGAVRSTTVSVESQLVTDGKVVAGSWCRMCCSRELSRSSVTPALYTRPWLYSCTLSLYTVHSGHLAPAPTLTWTRWLPPVCRHQPPLPRTPGLTSPVAATASQLSLRQAASWLVLPRKETITTFHLTHLHLSSAATMFVCKTTPLLSTNATAGRQPQLAL